MCFGNMFGKLHKFVADSLSNFYIPIIIHYGLCKPTWFSNTLLGICEHQPVPLLYTVSLHTKLEQSNVLILLGAFLRLCF